MDSSRLADPAAVAAMAAGDPAGLEAVYRRYADRLHAYARSIVDDADVAADVVQDSFVIAAERVRQLRDPTRLAAWLYAIARNECLARLRARKRTVMLADAHEPVLDTDPGRALHAAQVRELVHAASAGMNEGDREIFELTVRHGMGAGEVGRVLDISEKHAHARISRARDQFEGALGALMLARDGQGRCGQLDGVLRGWDGRLTVLLRKRIERHSRDCDVCAARRRERMDPATLLAGYAALPFLAVGASLWEGVRLRLVSTLGPVSSAATPAGEPSTVPVRGSEPPTVPIQHLYPRTGEQLPPVRARSRTAAVVVAAVLVLVVIVGLSALRLLTLDRQAAPVAAATPSAVTSTPAATAVTSSPPTTPAPTTPVPFTVTAEAQWVCGPPPPYQITITAHAHGVPFGQARVHWTGSGDPSVAMNVSGFMAQRTLLPGGSASTLQWWVTATATDGRSVTTPKVVSVASC